MPFFLCLLPKPLPTHLVISIRNHENIKGFITICRSMIHTSTPLANFKESTLDAPDDNLLLAESVSLDECIKLKQNGKEACAIFMTPALF